MKPVIFIQRVTIFVPAFVSYSASNEILVASVLPPITEKGVAGWGPNMMCPPMPFAGGQIPTGAPWFVKFGNV